ncbi:hypothetical protein VTO73DRAFT_3330 [Trametes versicolor]
MKSWDEDHPLWASLRDPSEDQRLDSSRSFQDFIDDHRNVFAIWAITLTALNALYIIYIIYRATRVVAARRGNLPHPDVLAARAEAQLAQNAAKTLDESMARWEAMHARIMDAWNGMRKDDAMLDLRLEWYSSAGECITAQAQLSKARISIMRMQRALDDADKQRQAAVAQCLEVCTQAKAEKDETLELLRKKEAERASQEGRNMELRKECAEFEAAQLKTEEQMQKTMQEKEELEQALRRKAATELKAALEDFMTVWSESQ